MVELAVGVAGVAGRMGRMLVREVVETAGCRLAAGSVRPGSEQAGADVAAIAGLPAVGVAAVSDPDALLQGSAVVIDFTLPGSTAALAARAAALGRPLVVGTTGLGETETAALRAAAKAVPIVFAANMSVGVNLLLALVEEAARRLDDLYDIEIVEMHHNRKIDAPSGTALALGDAAAAGRGVSLAERALRGRDGHTGARPRGAIGFAALRGGDVIGDHTVVFAGPGERVEIGHRAGGRQIYAAGAVRAARWVVDRPPGLYGMRDVLGM